MIKNINMKSIIKSIILFSVCAVSFLSCETYSDPKVDYSPIFPISGEWRVRITNMNTNALVSTSMYTFGTYNTSDNATNQMWLRTTSAIPTFAPVTTIPRTIKAKISCDVANLSFSTTTTTQNTAVTAFSALYPMNSVVDTLVITEGKITLNSVDMPSGVKSDRIYFKLTKTKAPGVTYLVEGYRRTLWNEDESVIAFK